MATVGNGTMITFNINTGNPDKQILQNAKALIDSGCRVFWNYVHTNQLDSDIQKAKKISATRVPSSFV